MGSRGRASVCVFTAVALFFFVFASVPLSYAKSSPLSLETSDGENEIKFGVLLQPQYQFLSIEGQGKVNTFQIRRGRIIFEGHAFGENLTYKLQFEVVGGRNTDASPGVAFGTPTIRDAYVNYDFGRGIEVIAGQFKPYYNREELTADHVNQFVDRSINNETFTFSRDIGAALHGKPFNKKLEYALYAVNDSANFNTANRDLMFVIGGRFVFNALGEPGYVLSDLDNSESPQLAFALGGNYNRLGAPVAPNANVFAGTADFILRYRGLSLYGEGNYFRQQGPKTSTFGFIGEAGYFAIPKHFEIVGRYAGVIPTKGVTKGYEAGACLNYFFYGQNLKLQLDYGLLINGSLVKGASGAGGVNGPANIVRTGGAPGFIQGQFDHRVRLQLQLYL